MSITEYDDGIRLPHHMTASGTMIARAAADATIVRRCWRR